jgi:hypothetical protein
MRPTRPRAAFGIFIIVAVPLVLVPQARTWMLRQAGQVLVAEDPLAPADVIVLTVDARRPGVVEAIDLVEAGLSQRVAFFVDPRWRIDEARVRQGVRVDDVGAGIMYDLLAAGVVDVAPIPTAVNGTRDEGPVLARWCADHRVRSVIVVAPPDHTRRVRRMLRRSMKDVPTRVVVRAIRSAEFEPSRWWYTRGGVRTQLEESGKLLMDLLRHPFS